MLGLGSSCMVTSCNKEYINPSTAPVPVVITNVDALMTVCAGLQRRFTIGRQSPLYTAPIGATYSVFGLYTLNIGNTLKNLTWTCCLTPGVKNWCEGLMVNFILKKCLPIP